MANKFNGQEINHQPSRVDLELLEALLETEDATYPWNLADEASEAYFEQLEQQSVIQDVLDEELTTRSEAFYSQLDNLWSSCNSVQYNCNTVSAVDRLQESLQSSFVNIPKEWIGAIAQKAAQIYRTQQSIGEQLIECVQTVLPSWGTDDLFVIARPFAYAMRSGSAEKSASAENNFAKQEWNCLSQIEQAKLSMALAHHALSQLNSFQEEP